MKLPSLPSLLVVVALAAPVGVARADAPLSPADGAVVESKPTFAFDFTNGVADIELSRSPDVRTAGDNVGAFVDQAASDYALLYARDPRDGLAPFPRRLDSGLYYWHARLRNDDAGFLVDFGPWTSTMRLTVRDEPIIFEGWTLTAKRLKQRGNCKRLRLSGTIAYNDNDPTPSARLTLVVRAGGKVVARQRGSASTFGQQQFNRIVCVGHRRVQITPWLRDRAGQLTSGPERTRNPG